MDFTGEEKDFIVETVRRHVAADVEVFFFGSRVDGTSNVGSDLDVLLKGKTAVDLGDISLLKEAFEASNIPFKVDILDYNRCDKQMIKNISKNLFKVFPK